MSNANLLFYVCLLELGFGVAAFGTLDSLFGLLLLLSLLLTFIRSGSSITGLLLIYSNWRWPEFEWTAGFFPLQIVEFVYLSMSTIHILLLVYTHTPLIHRKHLAGIWFRSSKSIVIRCHIQFTCKVHSNTYIISDHRTIAKRRAHNICCSVCDLILLW